ncbi:glutamyl-tRNA(Gln) amidotransferase subunit B, mitochondrial-like [Centruroides sculpturatus]|uniref:glutamyl-tRNA(Gln) amidotransferase subunit B, mitochondrial-like n=1 Tax=Centruroides sculpturatus TaxID=218467 RepID=UPI000C6E0F80|nr:glutamyl-tRNA(Gln) amidotransferase subunit B, mitochondrial-like [Centruroides sculpturatus]XP_023219245.1 glutamyl-tRNA(Gln) amidotransferase subunit B, mitochondrial-like [Centruroides sculpturatus]
MATGGCRSLSLKYRKTINKWFLNKMRYYCNQNVPNYAVDEAKWESVVGLEIHAQISSRSKLFSRSSTEFAALPNSRVSFFDAALPGTLPVLNRSCVESAVLTALALGCTVHKVSLFDRKHYFYVDLPAGYQITQQRKPIATDGKLEFVVYNSAVYKSPFLCSSRIKQLQLEQDSGRSLHDVDDGRTLVDLNRAGIGLMEIVFEPDLRNGEEAAGLIRELQKILQCLGTCSGYMNEGAMRIDANISVNRPGEPMGIRTELKNINSARYVAKAIDFEIKRQIRLLEAGENIKNETRKYDHVIKETVLMREKENVQDYRYMPEPNLPPLRLYDDLDKENFKFSSDTINIDHLRENIPLLPADERKYLIEKYKLPLRSALLLMNEDLQELFKEVATGIKCNMKFVSHILLTDILSQLNKRKLKTSEILISIDRIQEYIEMIDNKIVTAAKAKDVLQLMFDGDSRFPIEIVRENNWTMISNLEELKKFCSEVIKKNPNLVKKYQNGKSKFLSTLVNEVKKTSENRANVQMVEEILITMLNS